MKGAYILKIRLDKGRAIQIGKLGKIFFKKGFYFYVGSAMNSLEKRIERHLSKNKKLHWHIDYFLRHGEVVDVQKFPSDRKEECKIARKMAQKFEQIAGFGCSDCKCKSHLFFEEF